MDPMGYNSLHPSFPPFEPSCCSWPCDSARSNKSAGSLASNAAPCNRATKRGKPSCCKIEVWLSLGWKREGGWSKNSDICHIWLGWKLRSVCKVQIIVDLVYYAERLPFIQSQLLQYYLTGITGRAIIPPMHVKALDMNAVFKLHSVLLS